DTGIELSFREMVFLRAGYSGLGIEDDIEGFSIGAGANVILAGDRKITIDYGFKDFGPFGYLQAIALDIGL
ncbi:MAG: hypothetical protein V3W14_08435, partial [Candidatus Neomarinimicrobiota bacterium]